MSESQTPYRNKILEKENPELAKTKREISKLYYFANSKFSYVNKWMFYEFCEHLGIEFIQSCIEESRNWSIFRDLCEEEINKNNNG